MRKKYGPFKKNTKSRENVNGSEDVTKASVQSSFSEFIKVPTFSLAYLYLICICYHLGYWNGFRIDVFNFYDIQDLAKGATHGLTETMLFVVLFIIPIGGTGFLLNGNLRDVFLKWVLNNKKTYFGSTILIIALSALSTYFQRKQTDFFRYITSDIIPNNDNVLLPKLYIAIAFVLIYSCAATAMMNKQFSDEARLKDRFSKTIVYSFILILPAMSYLSALNNSVLTRRGIRFDYVISNKVAKNEYIYKYLGKAGGYYFLSTLNGRKTITIKTDSLQPLTVNYFSSYDSTSGNILLKEYKTLMGINKKHSFIKPHKKILDSISVNKTIKKGTL